MGAPSVLFTLLGITEDSSEVLCFPLAVRSRADENRIAALERKVGQRRVEIDFLQRCLLHVGEQRRLQALTTSGSSARTSKSK